MVLCREEEKATESRRVEDPGIPVRGSWCVEREWALGSHGHGCEFHSATDDPWETLRGSLNLTETVYYMYKMDIMMLSFWGC